MKVTSTYVRRLGLGSIVLSMLIVGTFRVDAQTRAAGNTVSLAGNVVSLTGRQMTVETKSGPAQLEISDQTIIRGELPIKFSEITAGMYVAATAAKQPDGIFRATRLNVFSEDQRGLSEGHRPLTSAPQSGLTMTNANVETAEDRVVQNIKGRMLTLKYRDGEIKVFVPADALVAKRVIGDRSFLKPGAQVSLQATPAADGSLTATQITVRASVAP